MKPREKPYKRKPVKVKKTKTNPLDVLLSADQAIKVRNIITRGGSIIITGSLFAPIGDFYKGLHMWMISPTYNGAIIFDTSVLFGKNYNRPLYLLTLNDIGNTNILHSIREIKEGKIYTRYVYHPE